MDKTKLTVMANMQNDLNMVINPNWHEAGYPWPRAIMVEAVEALEHYGWKWWKAQPPQTPEVVAQIQLELVDIWHFAMSHIIGINIVQGGDVGSAIDEMFQYFSDLEANPDHLGDVSQLGVHDLFDMLIGSAGIQRQVNGAAFSMLMRHFDLSWDKMYDMYIGKNVLNQFRQANGYKEGTYMKIWNGQEDNVYLAALMERHPDATPTMLNNMLVEYYKTVVRVH